LALNDRGFLDGCLKLSQKKLRVVEPLKLGYSRDFIEAAKHFVAGTLPCGDMPS